MSSKRRKPTAAQRARAKDEAEQPAEDTEADVSTNNPENTEQKESVNEEESRTVKRARQGPTTFNQTAPSMPDLEKNLLRTNLVGSYDRPYLSGALQGGQSRYEEIVRAVSQGVLNSEGPREMRSGKRYPMAPPPLPRRAAAPQPQGTNRSASGSARATTPSTPSTHRSVSLHSSSSGNLTPVSRNLAPSLPHCYVGVFKGDRGNVDDCSSTVSYSSGSRSNATLPNQFMGRPGAQSYLRYPRDATIPDSQPSLGTLSSLSSPARTAQLRYPRDATIPDSQPSLGTLSSMTGSIAARPVHQSPSGSVLNSRRSSVSSTVPPSEHPLYRPPGPEDDDDDRTIVAGEYSSFRLPEGPRSGPHGLSQADIERWLGATRSDSHSDAGSVQEAFHDAHSQVLPTTRNHAPPVLAASRTPGVFNSRTFLRSSSRVYAEFPALSHTSSHVAPSVASEDSHYIDAPPVDISSHAGDSALERTQIYGIQDSFRTAEDGSQSSAYIDVPPVAIPAHPQDTAIEDTQACGTPYSSSRGPGDNGDRDSIHVPPVDIGEHAGDIDMEETQVVGIGTSSLSQPNSNASSGVIDAPAANISSHPGDGDLDVTQMCAAASSFSTVREGSGFIDAPPANISAHADDGNLEATQLCTAASSFSSVREGSGFIDAPPANISAHADDGDLEATQLCAAASSVSSVRDRTNRSGFIDAPRANISSHPEDGDLEATQMLAMNSSSMASQEGITRSAYIDVPPADISAHPDDGDLEDTQIGAGRSSFATARQGNTSTPYINAPPAEIFGHPGDADLEATQLCAMASSSNTVPAGNSSSAYINAPPADLSTHPDDVDLPETQACEVVSSLSTVNGGGMNSSGYINAPAANISAHPGDGNMQATQVCAVASSSGTVSAGSLNSGYIDVPPVDMAQDPRDNDLQDTQLCALPTPSHSMGASTENVLVPDSQDATNRGYIDAPPLIIDAHPEDGNLDRTQVCGMLTSTGTVSTQRSTVGSSTSRVPDSFASQTSDALPENHTGRQVRNTEHLQTTESIAVPYPEYASDPRDADLEETQFVVDSDMDSKTADTES